LKEEPEKTNLTTEHVFDNFGKRYNTWYDKPFGKSAFNLEKGCIASLCENLRRPFLEIGVGTGRFAKALKVEHGVDTSVGMLRFAKKRGIMAIKGASEKLPFSEKFFGAVFIIVTLCFVDDPLKVIVEASRVLKDEGSIVLGLILKGSAWATFYNKKGETGNVFYKIAKFYSFEDLKAMIEKSGLKVMEISSTIFQAPTTNILRPESPRRGYYEKAGFVSMRLAKANSSICQDQQPFEQYTL